MSNWIELTEDDLKAYQLAEYIAAARTTIESGQADPLDEVIPSVVTRIRAEVRGCKTNRVSATANTIPPDLKSVGVYLVLEALQGRIPGLNFTETTKTLIDDAKKYLLRVSRCEVPIELPDDPEGVSTVQSGGPTVAAIGADRPKQSTRETQNRL